MMGVFENWETGRIQIRSIWNKNTGNILAVLSFNVYSREHSEFSLNL